MQALEKEDERECAAIDFVAQRSNVLVHLKVSQAIGERLIADAVSGHQAL